MSRRWKRLLVPTCFSFVVLVLLGVNYFAPFGDLDYTWQIRTGEKILATGDSFPAIPSPTPSPANAFPSSKASTKPVSLSSGEPLATAVSSS